jgi:PadR family transcriptional regulator, regulatory protein PadR
MMQDDLRLSGRGLRVLRLLLDQPAQSFSGAQISKATGTGSGTLYPLLSRLERAGWLSSEWEAVDPKEVGRPRRRLYKLTAVGQRRAQLALEGLQQGALAWAF